MCDEFHSSLQVAQSRACVDTVQQQDITEVCSTQAYYVMLNADSSYSSGMACQNSHSSHSQSTSVKLHALDSAALLAGALQHRTMISCMHHQLEQN
jgi:hypothetical protein